MTTPIGPDSSNSYESDLDAMRRDAAEWSAASERMSSAATVAGQLVLGDYELSIFGVESGLAGAYQEAQRWASLLLDGAHSNLNSMGRALTASADRYGVEEAYGARSFDKLEPGGN